MMGLQLQPRPLYTEARLAHLWEALDEIHSAASEGTLGTMTTLSKAELLGWLHEVLYTAAEAIEEIESSSAEVEPKLTLLKKSS
jgi:hypothetical protein